HNGPCFTTACTGQDLYCQMDAGYEPRHFVIGNVAYALGVGRGFMGMLRGFAGGEVKEFSDMYNHTRHLALQRLEAEARQRGANAVVDILTHIVPFGPGVKEMLMIGTASQPAGLGPPDQPVPSELSDDAQRATPAASDHPRPRHVLRYHRRNRAQGAGAEVNCRGHPGSRSAW